MPDRDTASLTPEHVPLETPLDMPSVAPNHTANLGEGWNSEPTEKAVDRAVQDLEKTQSTGNQTDHRCEQPYWERYADAIARIAAKAPTVPSSFKMLDERLPEVPPLRHMLNQRGEELGGVRLSCLVSAFITCYPEEDFLAQPGWLPAELTFEQQERIEQYVMYQWQVMLPQGWKQHLQDVLIQHRAAIQARQQQVEEIQKDWVDPDREIARQAEWRYRYASAMMRRILKGDLP